VVAEDPMTICRSPEIDVWSTSPARWSSAPRVILEAFAHGKPVVLMNAEVDATIGPILRVYAQEAAPSSPPATATSRACR
jgi:predicted homoserine dehydrogenase-like protein